MNKHSGFLRCKPTILHSESFFFEKNMLILHSDSIAFSIQIRAEDQEVGDDHFLNHIQILMAQASRWFSYRSLFCSFALQFSINGACLFTLKVDCFKKKWVNKTIQHRLFFTPVTMHGHRHMYKITSILPNKWCVIPVMWNNKMRIEWSIDLNAPQS